MVALTLKEKYELKKSSEIKNLDEGAKEIAGAVGSAAGGAAVASGIAAGVPVVTSAIASAVAEAGGLASVAASAGSAALSAVSFLAVPLAGAAAGFAIYKKINREDLRRSEAKWQASIKALEKLNEIEIPDSLPALKNVFEKFDKKIATLLATERSWFNKLFFDPKNDSKSSWFGLKKTDTRKMEDIVEQIEDFNNKLQKLYSGIITVVKVHKNARADMTVKDILDRKPPTEPGPSDPPTDPPPTPPAP